MEVVTSLAFIATQELEKEAENQRFRTYLKSFDSKELDALVHPIEKRISPQISCTDCGNCCQTLMINITPLECEDISNHMQMDVEDFKTNYVETSQQGMMIMNQMPCAFLKDKKCTVYEHRFTECREFPHLHKADFQQRLFGTLMHYGRCPIIYNVIEVLKIESGFEYKD
jgi:uncharacterized protein